MTTANGHFLLSSYLWFLNILQWKCIMCSKKKKKSYFATRFRMPNSCLRQVMCHLYSTTLSIQFSRSVVSDSLRPHEPQHARPPCPSPAPRVYPNPCPLSQWYHLTISCHPLLLLPSIFPSIRVFFKWVSSSHQVAKVLEFQLQHQSFQWTPRIDLL